MSISESIRQAARNSGQTQVELATGAGISQGAISSFLRGGELRSASLDKLAAYLGVEAKVPKRLKKPSKTGGL